MDSQLIDSSVFAWQHTDGTRTENQQMGEISIHRRAKGKTGAVICASMHNLKIPEYLAHEKVLIVFAHSWPRLHESFLVTLMHINIIIFGRKMKYYQIRGYLNTFGCCLLEHFRRTCSFGYVATIEFSNSVDSSMRIQMTDTTIYELRSFVLSRFATLSASNI